MSGLLAIALAGAAVGPAVPIDGRDWFTSKDQPKTALAVAHRGPVYYTIDVASDGKAIRCTPREDDDLDRRVCELVMKRARFQPAVDDRGRPSFALHEGVASFLLPGKTERPDRAKLTVTVDALPAGVTSPAYTRIAFLVDGTGAISRCASVPGEGRRMPMVEALGRPACEHIATANRPSAARDEAGQPVSSVQSIVVRFALRPS